MSYPQFNLTILQLPAPASNMTKAEYKAAYGINLDEVNIKAFKLVLLGNEKYPIDQIKEVEGGYEIYFNGRILSITDIVQTSDEVYDVANSKPIYIHPLLLTTSDKEVFISLFIFNNSAEAFDTKAKFLEYVRSIQLIVGGTARFPVSGAYVVGTSVYTALSLEVPNQNIITLYGLASDLTSVSKNIETLSFTVTDGVNKIN